MLSGSGFALRSSGLQSPFAGADERQEGKMRRQEGVQEEEMKMKDEGRDKKERKSALVVKRKQVRETGKGGGVQGVMGKGELTLQNWTLMGARPCLSGFSLFLFPLFALTK